MVDNITFVYHHYDFICIILIEIIFSLIPAFFSCQGIKARILETFVMLFLLALLILGIVWVASALIDNDVASMESLYGMIFVIFYMIGHFKPIVFVF